jgi:hypothetical protein
MILVRLGTRDAARSPQKSPVKLAAILYRVDSQVSSANLLSK